MVSRLKCANGCNFIETIFHRMPSKSVCFSVEHFFCFSVDANLENFLGDYIINSKLKKYSEKLLELNLSGSRS